MYVQLGCPSGLNRPLSGANVVQTHVYLAQFIVGARVVPLVFDATTCCSSNHGIIMRTSYVNVRRRPQICLCSFGRPDICFAQLA